MKNLISLRDWSGEHIEHVLQLAAEIKKIQLRLRMQWHSVRF